MTDPHHARAGGRLLLAVLGIGNLACDPPQAPAKPQPIVDFEQARLQLPTVLDVQVNLMTHTCSPNPGVCHQGREYPELHTVASFAEIVGADCNIAPPAPEQGWDACERPPYWVALGEFGSAIAWKEHIGPGEWTFGLANPIPAGVIPTEPVEEHAAEAFKIVDDQTRLAFAPADDWLTTLSESADAMSVTVHVAAKDPAQDISGVVDTVLGAVVDGDPNMNGIWGGLSTDPKAQLIAPGSRKLSYLWRRLIGDVPGDRMPIANGPVTNAQLLALGCLIEGLDPQAPTMAAQTLIDYDNCSFSDDPPLLVDPWPDDATDSPEQDTD